MSPKARVPPATVLLLFWASACGGQTIEEPEAPVDPADPDVLPTGTYDLEIDEASCNVNDWFRPHARVFIYRSGAAANIPLPLERRDPTGLSFGAPRAKQFLGGETSRFTVKNDSTCDGGTVLVSTTMTRLTRTRAEFAYREEPSDCPSRGGPCTVKLAFELAERSCPPASDPGCVPHRRFVSLGSNTSQSVDCECSAR